PRGGDYQNKIHHLILAHKTTPGDTVDIGCGNGNLIIQVAKSDRSSAHLGLDYWGKNWEYSIGQCQVNARIEGAGNVEFVKASAARTGLENESYQYVVSCLTFHEVRDQPDTAKVVAEALRVLKPGGTYIFVDLFDDNRHYPSVHEIVKTIELAGCTISTDAPLSGLMSLPFPLNDKNALRYARLMSGEKSITV
ncbi:MAG TPA: class I SAM-dependent methyltransferase, partial [Spirochaetia bacterium]|nr:class I SAM-dependent methyltransferase [Spirochaetia bacterium]